MGNITSKQVYKARRKAFLSSMIFTEFMSSIFPITKFFEMKNEMTNGIANKYIILAKKSQRLQ